MSKLCKYVSSGVIRAVPFHFTLKSRYTWLSQFALHSNLEHRLFVSSPSDQAQKLFFICSHSIYSDVFFSLILQSTTALYTIHMHISLCAALQREGVARKRKSKASTIARKPHHDRVIYSNLLSMMSLSRCGFIITSCRTIRVPWPWNLMSKIFRIFTESLGIRRIWSVELFFVSWASMIFRYMIFFWDIGFRKL